MTDHFDVLIIGAGVIGLSIAHEAMARGLSVRVIDREGPAAGASAGNAGAFAFADILPLASPGIMRKAPGWLLDPLGPLSVPPRYALRIAPWMLRFWRASWPDRVVASTAAQTALMDLSRDTLEPFLKATGTERMLRRDGQLQVYEGAREFEASLPGWEARAAHGIEFRHLKGQMKIAEIQPGLSPRFTHAGFTPSWASVSDPLLYALALVERLVARGGRIDIAEARAIAPEGRVLLSDGQTLQAGHVVLAAGAHSHRLARTLGDRIPLETERGYNTTLPAGAFDLRCQVTFGGHGFVVTRIGDGIRVGGAVELGGLELPPNHARARAMLKKAARFLPGLKTEGGTEWMGFRPSLPDTLPAIGRSSHARNVIYAFGHGHLGLTQSSGTATLVAELLTGQAPSIDLAPFAPDRFKGLI